MSFRAALIALAVFAVGAAAPAQAQNIFPISASILTPATVINQNNPVSASSITDVSGHVWSFGAVINSQFGGYHVLEDGQPQDTPAPTYGTWQLRRHTDGTMYAMDLAGDQWYHWNGSAWTAVGTAPPVSSTSGISTLASVFPNGLTDTSTLTTWLGRVPDTIGSLPQGPLAYFSLDGFFPPNGVDNWPVNISYRMDVCTNAAPNVFCNTPNNHSGTSYMPDYVGFIAGNYDALMTSQLQQFVLPHASQLYYVRMNSEWEGNFWNFSPYYGSTEFQPACNTATGNGIGYCAYGTGTVPPNIWVAALQHMITLFRNVVVNGPGGNPNIKIQFDAPYDDIQAQYYPGDAYVDILGTDLYISSTSPTNSAAQFQFYMSAGSGFASNAYMLTFAQKHNKASVYPEWCDGSASPNQVDGTMITLFDNLFASVNGPGNSAIVDNAYWDQSPSNGGYECTFTDYAAKQNAYAQAWPNGFQGTFYSGTYFTQKPMPIPNPWQPSGGGGGSPNVATITVDPQPPDSTTTGYLEKTIGKFTSTSNPSIVIVEADCSRVLLYQNNNPLTGTWTSSTLNFGALGTPPSPFGTPYCYERAKPIRLAGDTYDDIVLSTGSTVSLMVNPANSGGNPTTAQWQRVTITSRGAHDIKIADIDGDGKMDIIGSGSSTLGAEPNFIAYQNSPTSWQVVDGPLAPGGAGMVDGIAVGNVQSTVAIFGVSISDNNLYWAKYPGSRTGTWTLSVVNAGDAGVSLVAGNFADGVSYVAMAENEVDGTGGLRIFKPTSNPTLPWNMTTVDGTFQAVHEINAGSWNSSDYLIAAEQEQACSGTGGFHGPPCRMTLFQTTNDGVSWVTTSLATQDVQNQQTIPFGTSLLVAGMGFGDAPAVTIWDISP